MSISTIICYGLMLMGIVWLILGKDHSKGMMIAGGFALAAGLVASLVLPFMGL